MPNKKIWAASTLVGILGAACLFTACSGGDSDTARFGTPAWYWQAAQDTFKTGDFGKTDEHLAELVKGDSEWKQRAAVWQVVLLTGLVRGNRELVDACKQGMEEKKSSIDALQNPLRQYQRDARQYTIELLESWAKLKKAMGDGPSLPLDFPFPPGNASESPVVAGIRMGNPPDAAQMAEAAKATLQRGVLQDVTKYVGAGEDMAKAQGMFNNLPVQVAAVEFWNHVGNNLFEMSSLFEVRQINDPTVRKIMLERSLDALSGALASDNVELKKGAEQKKSEIEKELKNIKV